MKFDKILLIDDQSICNFITSTILEKANIAHSVESFLGAKEALVSIQNDNNGAQKKLSNLILLDINMPEMDGWGFLDSFERLPENLVEQYSVMMLSSSIDTRDIEKSMSYKSVKKFISKPFSVEKLSL